MNAEECWANFFWAVAIATILCTGIVQVCSVNAAYHKQMIESGHSYDTVRGWIAPSPEAIRVIVGPTVERPLPAK